MHLPIRAGIQEALKELKALRDDMEDTDCYLDSFEYFLKGRMVERIKEVRVQKKEERCRRGKSNPSTASTQVNTGHAQTAERVDSESGGDQNQETGGEEAESLQKRRGVV